MGEQNLWRRGSRFSLTALLCRIGLHEWDTRWLPIPSYLQDGPERFCRQCGAIDGKDHR